MSRGAPTLVNRRYLRIKVFQGLYAYHRTSDPDQVKLEREIFESINRLYTLYLYLVSLVMQVGIVAGEIVEQRRRKNLPSNDDLHPNMRFVENRVFSILKDNVQLKLLIERQGISWKESHDDIRRIYKAFREDEVYQLYMIREENSLEHDKDIIIKMFREYLGVSDVIHSTLEEMDIYWQDDLPIAALTVVKTIQSLPDFNSEHLSILADLYKHKEDDQSFAKELFRKSVQCSEEYGELISDKAVNWETERIALLDMLLMTMAIAELEHFPTVPVKVTLNEYIELAKVYSTPKSKVFINGVLDKLVDDLRAKKRINKRGRGLME